MDASAGSTNIKVTSVSNISVGDKIRLDIDSVGHGIETVTVTKVGTQSIRTTLSANADAGATNIRVRSVNGFAVGDKIILGTPANQKTYAITAVGTQSRTGATMNFTPAFAEAHSNGEDLVSPGTGLDLAAPLRFNHAANLPFSNRKTGISFQPATAFAHSSNEPVQALGTGITLDSPLVKVHTIDAVVRDAQVTTAGYQGTPETNQWFGGPALSNSAGNMVLLDAADLVVDSLNTEGSSTRGLPRVTRPSPEQNTMAATCPRPVRQVAPVRARAASGRPRYRQQLHRLPDGARYRLGGRFGRRCN